MLVLWYIYVFVGVNVMLHSSYTSLLSWPSLMTMTLASVVWVQKSGFEARPHKNTRVGRITISNEKKEYSTYNLCRKCSVTNIAYLFAVKWFFFVFSEKRCPLVWRKSSCSSRIKCTDSVPPSEKNKKKNEKRSEIKQLLFCLYIERH